MSQESVSLRTADGVVDAFVYRPPQGGGPGVLHLTDIHGLRSTSHELAERVAAEGFVVLAPNVFYRTRRPPLFDFPVVFGEPRTTQRFGELVGPLTPDAIEHDARAYTQYLAALPGVVGKAQGVVGYCYTGGVALRMAAACPERLLAVASFHGGNLLTAAPTSPHLVLPRVKAQLYFGHASEDKSMPAPAIEQLAAALAAWGGRYENETYPAKHGWTMRDSAAYSEPDAERAYTKQLALLRTLSQH